MYFQQKILRRLKDKLAEDDLNMYDDKYIANNLAKVNVFYKELGYKEITEEPGYEVCNKAYVTLQLRTDVYNVQITQHNIGTVVHLSVCLVCQCS